MRSRDDLEEVVRHIGGDAFPGLIFEILLDIREMLIPLGQTHYTVTSEKINLGELIRKYAVVPQRPSGDIVTTKENQDAR